jgi:hypothetical protein
VPTTPGEAVRVLLTEEDDEDGVWLIDIQSSKTEQNGPA